MSFNMEVGEIVAKMRLIKEAIDDGVLVPVYKIRINYKSGIQEEFWCSEFTISDGSLEYKAISIEKRLLWLNFDNVESAYQVDVGFINKDDFDMLEEFEKSSLQ